MKQQFAVAHLHKGAEVIMGLFRTRQEADEYAADHPIPSGEGLQYCFRAEFSDGHVSGEDICICAFYHERQSARRQPLAG